MGRTYVDEVNLIEQRLQDSTNAEFLAADINFELEEGLKTLGSYQKHENLCPVIYKIESRTGTVSATSASNLTDTTKSQFVAADATNEKRVHNTTDDTWATISAYTSTSVLALNADIFVSGEKYEIYNKRCWNKRQIWIGDITDYLRIARVEYPIGRPRNFTLLGNNVLQIDVTRIGDSDPTLSTLGKVDVLVWFAKPHILSQLTDWAGEASASGAAGATSLAIDGMGSTEIIEEGEQFYLENHRTLYTITEDVTTSANAATIKFYPGLEAAVVDNDDITFVKSTLLPDDEENLADIVAANLAIFHAPKFIRIIAIGGRNTSEKYDTWGMRRLAQVQAKLRGQTGTRTTYHYSRY